VKLVKQSFKLNIIYINTEEFTSHRESIRLIKKDINFITKIRWRSKMRMINRIYI
jgi:hypothetical protein